MPTYEYECEKCRRVFEVRQRITDAPLTACEECGGAVRRLLSPAPFILKGEGWYVTDYPSEARKKARESEKSADKRAPAASSSSGGDGAGGTDKKPSKESTSAAKSTSTPSSD